VIGTTMIKVKREIQWDRSQIRVSGRGSGPLKKKRLKNDRYHVIRMNRGIQGNRSQIRVLMGPLFFFFFTSAELYSGLKNTAVTNAQIVNRKKLCRNFATRMQEARLCDNISFMFFSVMFLSQGLGFSGFLQTRVFPVL
jgi:hypothetical protein